MKQSKLQFGSTIGVSKAINDPAAACRTLNRINAYIFSLVLVSCGFTCLTESTSFALQRLAALPNSRPVIQDDNSASGISSIELLDSPSFIQRQSATQRIIAEGADILPILAERFFESSPETNYRIRKALEGIAAGGDEETFLKSSAILLTLYSNGNDRIFQQIEEIKVDWQKQRTALAIKALKRTGAEVAQQRGYSPQVNGRAVVVRSLGTIRQTADAEKIQTRKPTVVQQKKLVQTILASDAETNRDLVFEMMPKQARVNQALSIGITSQNLPHLAGTTVKFPKGWASNTNAETAFAELSQIDDRLFVQFSDADLSKAQWESLAANENVVTLSLASDRENDELPSALPESLQSLTLIKFAIDSSFADLLKSCSGLQQLQLNNCQFDERAAERIDGVNSVKSIVCQFENTKVTSSLLRAMAEFNVMRAAYFTAVEFDEDALANLRRLSNLSILHVTNMPATSEFFQAVSTMPRLNSIQFKGCRLDIPAYKRLAKLQRVRMNFEAQAFLGIQGSGVGNPGRMGADTMVSLVIPDSAADEGGIEAGDFINKIDGEKVIDFNDVRLFITQYAAGDEVAIEVLRDGKLKALTVTLRDYKTARKF